MVGLGTLINCGCILLGGIFGMLFGRFVKENVQDALSKVCGLVAIFMALSGAMEEMLRVENGKIVSSGTMLILGSLSIGTLLGELCGIEKAIERFGQWLKIKTGNAKDGNFVEAFVTASLTICIGAMAIVGAIEEGVTGNYEILATKAVLDLVTIMVMTCAMGKGCIFSMIPVALLQGGVTALAGLLKPIMTEQALSNLSMVGSVMIFCVGVNLIWGKKIRVANMLPAIVFATAAAFLPIA
ncbi:MAG: DUF554 domain-containing protein [Ruminococcaceae bacterium]|nr:DUF554 domain-containing protein [Oscillospiraceae bacterium]